MSHGVRWWLSVLVCSAGPTIHAAAAGPATRPAATRAAPADRRQTASPGQALQMLNLEARGAWKAHDRWPREAADFAATKELRISNQPELVRTLTRRFNDQEAIDAYLKWQLLSFEPDFKAANEETLRRLVFMIPPLQPQPEPRFPSDAPAPAPTPRPGGLSIRTEKRIVVGQQPIPGAPGGVTRPRTATVRTGTGIAAGAGTPEPEPAPTVDTRAVVERFARARDAAAFANTPILAYREALIARLPERDGLRLSTMIRDTRDRILAGDPSSDTAVDRLLAACRAVKPDAYTDETRDALGRQIELLADARGHATERVWYNEALKEFNHDGHDVEAPLDKLNAMLEVFEFPPLEPPPAAPPGEE